MIYCQSCGLWMTNGFCPHGNVDLAIAAQQERATVERDLLAQLPAPPVRKQGKR